ncbi:hypothetical protein FHW03_001536 [Ochrobactrum sp. RH2CCR150]|nr:hypothetical protein [Ochrobactrum sp. RH2CCR150]
MSLFMNLSASAKEMIPDKGLRFIRKSMSASGLFLRLVNEIAGQRESLLIH